MAGGGLSRAQLGDPFWRGAHTAAVVPGPGGSLPLSAGRSSGAERLSGGHAGDAGDGHPLVRGAVLSEGDGFLGAVDGRAVVAQHVLAIVATQWGGGCPGWRGGAGSGVWSGGSDRTSGRALDRALVHGGGWGVCALAETATKASRIAQRHRL